MIRRRLTDNRSTVPGSTPRDECLVKAQCADTLATYECKISEGHAPRAVCNSGWNRCNQVLSIANWDQSWRTAQQRKEQRGT